MKKKISLALSTVLFLGCLSSTACTDNGFQGRRDGVLRVASWDEYIDMGGTDSWVTDSDPLYEEFEVWYEETYGKSMKVEYVALQDNETMYGKIKMGDTYDLLCPSEYMIMKLAAENKLQPFTDDFHDPSIEHNYYAQHVSPYIQNIFEEGEIQGSDQHWADYAAGYMWGTTGFVFNPEEIGDGEEEAREIMKSWNAFTSTACKRKITAKDNVRDSYFVGLGMYYEEELLSLKTQYENGEITQAEYKETLALTMNDTSETTMSKVKEHLIKMRKNLYGLETDEGKLEVISGRLDASFQWSGDAVYILSEAEENGLALEYSIPESASNLWFDGWVMMKGANTHAAQAFINFLSRPDNVVRNMYYIGYTSCIAGDGISRLGQPNDGQLIFDYVQRTYEDAEGSETYDLSYFFGKGATFQTSLQQTRRQLFAQYPEADVIDRLVVMKYFDKKTNERANRMWNNIK